MYAYFIGKITEISEDCIVLETNHIGYNIYMPSSTIQSLSVKREESVKIYTYTCVREDAFILYGFLSKDDIKLFKLLISVSGIGPKNALGILSSMDGDTFRMSILSQDTKLLSKSPGIGVKTANRLILELKDKIKPDDLLNGLQSPEVTEDDKNIILIRNEANEALTTLGYSSSDSYKILRQITITKDSKVENVIKEALKKLI